MMDNKKWISGFILVFLGNTLLLTQVEIPKILSIIIIFIGHLLIIMIGSQYFDLKKVIKVDITIGIFFTLYYFTCSQFQLGLFHNIVIAIMLLISMLYLKYSKC